MNVKFKQLIPSDFYIGMTVNDSLEADTETDSTSGFRPVGGYFLNAFVGNLHTHGLRSASFHANMLGISQTALCTTVLTLTGMLYSDFSNQYILLMVRDLWADKQWKKQDIATRVGMSTSGLFRLMVRFDAR